MNDVQRMGGIAALIEAGTYVVGFALLLTLLVPAGYLEGGGDPARAIAFLAGNQTVLYLWNLVIYGVSGVALVVLVLALHERLYARAEAMVRAATAFGLIWAGLLIATGMIAITGIGAVVELSGQDQAQAAAVWSALGAVQEGLGGGVELVGGLWVLLVSWAGLRAGGLGTALNWLGVLIGVAGVLTVVPALEVLTSAFGLGFIVWYAWVGIVLLRGNPSAAPAPAAALESAGARR